jgi:hypothetical protein
MDKSTYGIQGWQNRNFRRTDLTKSAGLVLIEMNFLPDGGFPIIFT